MAISASDVKALREKTGAGMMDCKKALSEAQGDMEKAIEVLRERGLAKAGKRAGRATSEGAIGVAIAGGIAGIAELGCETDFVAKTDAFQQLAEDVAALVARTEDVSVESALATKLDGETLQDRITSTISKVGENIELKRVARLVSDGTCGAYLHAGGKLGVIVALAGGSGLDGLAKDIAMHVAAHDPTPIAVDRSGVDAGVVEKERELLKREALQSGKPEKVVDKIVEGRINKFFADHCLLEQAFVKDPDRSVGDLVKAEGAEVSVAGFVRFRLGEASEG